MQAIVTGPFSSDSSEGLVDSSEGLVVANRDRAGAGDAPARPPWRLPSGADGRNARSTGGIREIPAKAVHVAICCATLRRPEGLRRLLDGLNGLAFSNRPIPRITVIVVDNDDAAPMRSLVEAVRPTFRWRLQYACEPVRGVSSARNRTLDLVPPDADYVAFIDDDEVPVPAWLDELLQTSRVYGAPIVQGPVRPMFSSPPPHWLIQGRFLELGPYTDGARLRFAYTGNSLVDAALIRRLALRFDPRFDRTGGEDQRFFGCVIKAGHSVVAAEKALVHEWIPKSRTTLWYVLQRRFRMGNTLATIDRIEGGKRRLAVRVIKVIGRTGLGVAQMVMLLPRGFAGLTVALCNMAWGAGALAGLFGVAHREYDTIHAADPPPARSSGWDDAMANNGSAIVADVNLGVVMSEPTMPLSPEARLHCSRGR